LSSAGYDGHKVEGIACVKQLTDDEMADLFERQDNHWL
jgi:hypothetical protein